MGILATKLRTQPIVDGYLQKKNIPPQRIMTNRILFKGFITNKGKEPEIGRLITRAISVWRQSENEKGIKQNVFTSFTQSRKMIQTFFEQKFFQTKQQRETNVFNIENVLPAWRKYLKILHYSTLTQYQ